MDLFVGDYETYYDQEYSLSKVTTEDYVEDPRYETIMFSLKKNNGPVKWITGTEEQVANWMHDQGVHHGIFVGHNNMFDGLIATSRHKIWPKRFLCTRFMAKPLIQPFVRSVSLDSCLKYIDAPVTKGGYVHQMKGRRRSSLSKSEWRDYSKYCCDDTEGTYHLFKWLVGRLPVEELDIIDMTLRMYLEPQLIADDDTFAGVLASEQQRKADLLAKLPEDVIRADLMSNPKFAQVLLSYGIEPPLKISPTTGKPTYAFAKNDPEWKDLEEELCDDPILGPILAARVGTKSTLAESRAERLLRIAQRHRRFRVPLIYCQAHTGRYGGTEKINAQNFTRIKIDPETKKPETRYQLRFGLQAPKHHSVVAPDLSQIEARINAWLSNCTPLLDLFADDDADPYAAFATKAYGKKVHKSTHPTERFVGKTCILGLGYGMGAPKLRATLRKDDLIVNEAEAQRFVYTYRNEYAEIPQLWKFCDNAIDVLRNGGKLRIGPCIAEKGKITLPNGMTLDYPNLKYIQNNKYDGWTYTYAGRVRTLWGGKIVENIVQSLARIKIMEAMRDIRKELGMRPVLQAHDELVYVHLTKHMPQLVKALVKIMSRPPEWAPNLPLAAEASYGPTYGDCK